MSGWLFPLNRRVFLKTFSFSALASLWPRKSAGTVNFQNNKNIPSNYIQNRDVPGFYIRSANPFVGVNPQEWTLSVGGLVKTPMTFSYEDLFGFPRVSQVSRLKCVECWSAKATWEGFRFQELVDKVQPDPKARYVSLQSADSYYESYALEELLRPRVLMVLRMNGQALSRDHGFPLRVIAPFKYGYKNIKYITNIRFTDSRDRNYWADYGPYSVDGTIQPGVDHPLDYNKKPLPINGGEVFHFFDSRPASPKVPR
ncbi:MAG: molybdopterin-dependent oxidoreductase [Nitrospinaceae bacterium]|nr:molybdopterin-dependent oxidoreductase [Nitrospinaceae bacterium]NIR54159.1 molybdopterin-dependent oxidoreductase [Nitrospinaceae bacterium]NIS84573.1 molybdopterin-dependent oxidoreductase [Nitrospinaceae bacterium]NIT81365.1 molybdopterin-dependent oxidoreductase [Nitrospinaceae bacterium]NIU43652.1 molybdopterin-dependent oxidoreductase [Nitrospinaceae bacterium]